MSLKKSKTRLILIFTIILSFIAQPTLASSLSTAMQVAPSKTQMDHTPSVKMQAEDAANHECQHMMMGKAALSKISNINTLAAPSSNNRINNNCLFTCQFCLTIAFILPHSLEIISNQEAHIIHVDAVQKPLSIFHIPAYEPPQLAS